MAPNGVALKRAAAASALEHVRSGMRIGLGSGSTVAQFLELLGERLRDGALTDIVGVPTSVQTSQRAEVLGIPLGRLHELAPLDLTVDGADEVDPALDLIKGLGGALLREKMVASASRRFVIIADRSKRVERLGTQAPLPIEVTPFAWQVHLSFLEAQDAVPLLRTDADGGPVVTDNGNYLIDCRFPEGLGGAEELERRLCARPGVIDTGLFLGLASAAFIAGEGGVEVMEAPPGGQALARGAAR